MLYIRAAMTALGAAGIVTKLLVAAGLIAAALTAYGVWHHKVYMEGWNDHLAAVVRGDAKTIAAAWEKRSKFNECRAQKLAWDQVTGACK